MSVKNAAAFGSIAASWTKWHSKLPVRLSSARNKKPILPDGHGEPVRAVTMFGFHPFASLVKPTSYWIIAETAACSGSMDELNLIDKELVKIMPVRCHGFSDFVNNVHVPYCFKAAKSRNRL